MQSSKQGKGMWCQSSTSRCYSPCMRLSRGRLQTHTHEFWKMGCASKWHVFSCRSWSTVSAPITVVSARNYELSVPVSPHCPGL